MSNGVLQLTLSVDIVYPSYLLHVAHSEGQSTLAAGVVLLIGVVIYLALMLLQEMATRDDPHRCDRAMSYLDAGCR
jgi:hypothetical protein